MQRWQLLLTLIVFWMHTDVRIVKSESQQLLSPAVAYQPRGFLPLAELRIPSAKQIREDLRLLRDSGFRSLVSYGANGAMGLIPEIARDEGFDGLIFAGIWDIFSDEEWQNAVSQAAFVDGYVLGNEGLGQRYSKDELTSRMDELRWETGLPVTTSEPVSKYFNSRYRQWLLENSDWLFPNVHPFWNGHMKPAQSVNWIIAYHDYLASMTGKKVILKEAGFPSAGSTEFSEESQLSFYKALESTGISFFYFEAFDQPWKRDILKLPEIEAHWGIFHKNGKPKKIIQGLTDRWSKR